MPSDGVHWVHELGAIDGWAEQLGAMPDASAWEIVDAIHAAWVAGEIAVVDGARDALDSDRRIGRFLRGIPEASRPTYVYRMRCDAHDVRRWCWAPEWFLMEQDEDLMLFGPEYVAPMLEEAAAGATKGDHAVRIVGHALRDQMHGALFLGSGALASAFAEIERVLPIARSCGADGLVRYLERLVGYQKPHRVDEAEARQRVFDHRRCTPNEHEEPVIARRDRAFRAALSSAAKTGTLVIDIATGAMHGEEDTVKKH